MWAFRKPLLMHQTSRLHDMRSFLTSFFSVFTDYANIPVYISGESYAGFYIPWIADHLIRMQERNDYDRDMKLVGGNVSVMFLLISLT